MLEPEFFAVPESLELADASTFRVTGYSRAGNYTLVFWRSGAEEFISGETLYQGETEIDTEGGRIPLYDPTQTIVRSSTPRDPVSIFEVIPKNLGASGLPPAIAGELRDPKNKVTFDL